MKKLLLLILLPTFMFSQIDVLVDDGGLMYIEKTAYVYVSGTGDVNINSTGALIMNSDQNTAGTSTEYSLLWVGGDFNPLAGATGDAEYRRYTATVATRDFLSAPVTGEAFSAFYTRNSAAMVAGNRGVTSGGILFGPFDPSSTSAAGAYKEYATTETATMDVGVGYRSASALGESLSFVGDIHTGTVSVPITYGGTTGRFPNQNLIGNPYTTYISAKDVVNAMGAGTLFDPTYNYIYGWDGTVTDVADSDYSEGSTWVRINSTNFLPIVGGVDDIYMPPGQGFTVYANGASGTFDFTSAMRVILDSNGDRINADDFVAGRAANSATSTDPSNTNVDGYFQLRINNESTSEKHSSKLYFLDANASRGLDVTWDAGGSIPNNGIGTLLVDDTTNGTPFVIQCLEGSDLTNSNSDVVIPVFVNANAGVSYTISIGDEILPSGANIYLEDTVANTYTALNEGDYTFSTTTALTGAGRFYLRTNNAAALSNDDFAFEVLNVKSIFKSKTLKIEGVLNSKTQLSLFDVSGRLVNTYSLDVDSSLSERYIDVSNVSEGIYVAQLSNSSNQTKTNKIIIK